MLSFLFQVGKYFQFLAKVFAKPEKPRVYFRQFLIEVYNIGISSIGIVIIISIFMGAVITLQTAYNLENPLVPRYYIGLGTRDSMILEFSSTIVALILAGKVGSNIASEIGTMRITEQIDALEIMGVNSASYLIIPKIAAALFFFPVLTAISMAIGIFGGWAASLSTGVVAQTDYLFGLRYYFNPYYITYSMIKVLFFAFLITSVTSFQGYFVKGGALEVGRASTKGVVYSSILILLFNLILTQLLLT